MLIDKVISGGQTGVDQAALFVATVMGIAVGGWCPLNGLDENNVSILEKYPLKEVTGLSYEESIPERTKRNIDDSDGTLIVVPSIPLPKNISDGTLLTINYAKEKQKPYLLIESKKECVIHTIYNWIQENKIKVLNVGGPRESSFPGIYNQTCDLLQQFFQLMKSQT